MRRDLRDCVRLGCALVSGSLGSRRVQRVGRGVVAAVAVVVVVAFGVGRVQGSAASLERGAGRVEGIVYRVVAGQRLLLDAYLPLRGGERPVVVFVHGGGFRAGSRLAVAPGQQPVAAIARALVAHGFAVFSVDYRLAPRFLFPAAVDDLVAAVGWLRHRATRFRIDPGRVALFGASAGGDLALRAAFDPRLRRLLRAVVSWSGPMDLRTFYSEHAFVADYLGCTPTVCPGRYQAASPIDQIAAGDPPVLLVNGSHETVPLTQATRMRNALTAGRISNELLVITGSRHAGGYAAVALPPTIQFLGRHV